MPKVTTPTIPAGIATSSAAPGAVHANLKAALQSVEDQRREGKTDAQAALKAVMDNIEDQRRRG
jgi:hypothetical protein